MSRYLTHVIKDPSRKSFLKISKELILLFLKTGHFPIHYFTRFAYRNGVDCHSFIPNQKFNKYLSICNSEEHRYLVNDKYVFSKVLENHQVPQARSLATVYKGKMTLIDPIRGISSKTEAYGITDIFNIYNVEMY